MKNVLETRRLTLRPLTPEDFKDMADMLQDPEVMYAWEKPFSDEEVKAWIDRQLQRYERDGCGYWGAWNENGFMVGQMGLMRSEIGLSLGYILKKRFWHRGYAVEGAKALAEYARERLGASKLVADIRPSNRSSVHVAEMLGMTAGEVIIKTVNGKDMPHVVYTLHFEPHEMTEKEKMLAGQAYKAGDEVLVKERVRCRELMLELNSKGSTNINKRREILGELIRAGEGANIEPPFYCDYGYNIIAGKKFYANFDCVFLDVTPIVFGDNVMLGPKVQIYTATHPLNAEARIQGPESAKPITVGDNVWIGGGAILCPGVNIGSNTVIGAGSVVTRDIPAGVFAAGNPCKVVKKV